jgi:hypothetical protein
LRSVFIKGNRQTQLGTFDRSELHEPSIDTWLRTYDHITCADAQDICANWFDCYGRLSMRRHAHANPFARRHLNRLLAELKSKVPSEWPRHFYLSWAILHDELNVAEQSAHSILNSSVSAAHACGQAINRRVGNIIEFQTRNKLSNAFERIAKCTKRAPAKLRRRLDAAITPLIQEGYIDLEVIETIFDATVEVYSKYSHHEAAKTALAVLTYEPPCGERYMTVKNDFQCLGTKDRIKSEKTLTALGKASEKRRTTASDVFAALAEVLQSKRTAKLDSQIHTLIVDYVAAVADGWRRAGLRPARARHPEDPTYKSRFHRFVDLVLTGMVEPWARRHDGNLDAVRRQTQLAHEKLHPEVRSIVSPTLRRADVEWPVSIDHIIKALRRRFKNPTEILRK